MPTAAATAATSSGVKTRSIGWPSRAPEDDQHGRDEQRDLQARAVAHGHRELHLVLGRELDRHEVLGEVADRRDEHDADEERRQPERVDERLDRADEDLGQDGQERRRDHEHADRDATGPGRAAMPGGLAVAAERLVGVRELVDERQRIADDQRDGRRAPTPRSASPAPGHWCVNAKTAGTNSPMTARTSSEAFDAAIRWLNVCVPWRSPPTRMLAPRTSSRLPMIEPVSDALTTSMRPACRAKKAMISSAMLPNVALRMPPTRGPVSDPSRSVDRPTTHARPEDRRRPRRRRHGSGRRAARSRGRSRRCSRRA